MQSELENIFVIPLNETTIILFIIQIQIVTIFDK